VRNWIHGRRRSAQRRAQALEKAREVIKNIESGGLDPYEGYRALYGIYLDTSGMLEELKPLFRLPGIEPDGFIHVDDAFRHTVVSVAKEWLRNNPIGPKGHV
jgi:hypothetical protein